MSFDDYHTKLKTQAQKCEFTELGNMIRDKIVFSIQAKTLKERLLRERDLTIAKTIDLSTTGDKPRPPWLLLRPPTLLVNKYGRRKMF